MFAYMLTSKPCFEATHRDYFISQGLFFARACLKNYKCNIFTFKKQYGKINKNGK